MNKDQLSILRDNKDALNNSVAWLQRSFEICNAKHDLTNLSPEGMDDFECLTSRFARTADLLFNKLYRSIYYIQEGEARPWLDVLIHMEKIRLITSVEEARLIKELRNDIVHEYTVADLIILYKEVLNQTPILLKMVKNSIQEADKTLNKLKE